jgi:uncharacterized protein YecT (DUF1311 family)
MKVPVVLLACLLSAVASSVAPAQQARQLYDEAAKSDAETDRQLNVAYGKLIDDIKKNNDPERANMKVDLLRQAQRAWLKYREAQVQFVGTYNDIGSSSARAAGLSSYNIELTKSRIAELADVPDPF